MGLTLYDCVGCIHFVTYFITAVLQFVSYILLETSLERTVSDNVVCSEDDISNHYSKSILTIITGAIIVVHTILEIGFLFGNPVYRNWKESLTYIKKHYLSRNFQWKIFLSDIAFISLWLLFFCFIILHWILIMGFLILAIEAEWNSNGLVHEANPQSDHCCGSEVYTHGLIPNYTAVHPPSLSILNKILHCSTPNFTKYSGHPCCCFEPTRVVSYLNLEAYNLFISILRAVFYTCIGVGTHFYEMGGLDMEDLIKRKQASNARTSKSKKDNWTSTLAHVDINHNETNDSVADQVISQCEASTVLAAHQPRVVGRSASTPGYLVKYENETLNTRQRQSDDLVHLAYTHAIYSCTIEYWMELSLQGVSVKGTHNVHQIDIQNYSSGSRSFEVIKDSFGGYVVLIMSGKIAKGLLLATGSNASPNPIQIEMPTVSGAQIEIRTPLIPLSNIFEARVFSPGEESQRSMKLGDILVECRMDVYLGVVENFDEKYYADQLWSKITIVSLGVRNYSEIDSIRTEHTDCGWIFIVMRNGECRGIGLIHAPKKVRHCMNFGPGKNKTNPEYFVCPVMTSKLLDN